MNARRLPLPDDMLLLNPPCAAEICRPDTSDPAWQQRHLPRYFENIPCFEEKPHTHAASRWPEEIEALLPRKLCGGWAILPPGEEKLPVCLWLSDEGYLPPEDAFLPELQILAANGTAVLWCGEDQDPLAFLEDAAKELPQLDAQRICLYGVGLGGWRAIEILGKHPEIRAAILQGTLSNASTAYGTSGAMTEKIQGSLLDFYQAQARRSPIAKVDSIRTPCLILHGRNDRRCSPEQGEQIYSALKDRCPDVPARMVVFPDEGHVLRNPRHQARALQEMTGWMDQYLKQEVE